ncbi:MAG: hypothetical protein MUC85_11965, partial [Anaerolineales bacterium]|nr:hypothetical protein [Anaerolineales bacterium]
TPPRWAGLFLLTFILGHLYVLLEWIFTVTRPSYLDMFPLLANLRVLLFGSALAAGLAMLGLGALLLAGRLAGLRRWPRLFFWLGSLVPASILAALLLLLVDAAPGAGCTPSCLWPYWAGAIGMYWGRRPGCTGASRPGCSARNYGSGWRPGCCCG